MCTQRNSLLCCWIIHILRRLQCSLPIKWRSLPVYRKIIQKLALHSWLASTAVNAATVTSSISFWQNLFPSMSYFTVVTELLEGTTRLILCCGVLPDRWPLTPDVLENWWPTIELWLPAVRTVPFPPALLCLALDSSQKRCSSANSSVNLLACRSCWQISVSWLSVLV